MDSVVGGDVVEEENIVAQGEITYKGRRHRAIAGDITSHV